MTDSPTVLMAFWSKVKRRAMGDCWPWEGHSKEGYGTFSGSRPRPYQLFAHRAAYELLVGPIVLGPCSCNTICHTCHTPGEPKDVTYRRCVNPRHLYRGNQADNMRDKVESGRCNQANAKLRSDNTSGFRGVFWDRVHSRWLVTIRVGKKRPYIGVFRTVHDAISARLAAEAALWGKEG